MTATTNHNARAQQARKYATQAASAATNAAKTLANDPHKIDNGALRVVIYALLIPIGIVFSRNIRPYASFMAALMGADGTPPVARLAGLCCFAAVQYLEVFPQFLAPAATNEKRAARMWLSIPAYIVDIVACWNFWPPIKEGTPDGIMLVQFIDKGNLVMTLITVFGLAIWFWIRKRARRAA
ncbi:MULTISPECIES: hypothetical protein [Cyanophyceae]|uniref:hypothetical protein n=1 Tax=Cyanophyceae TaxID=3028117 RepID=UPI001681FD35|nr:MULTISPECIES: hypothetical protein [Cyanophyceae]MBD1918889.1 hypothetical protein [Phormidium sp. FACHB-77]MBD2033269.1 hypothetical protein [Phormidium sp. FACHB-322]MBD2053798.1 hypothetical protein [Leptolyngbya sp. FACHB-60]